jgi:hypothetical protein
MLKTKLWMFPNSLSRKKVAEKLWFSSVEIRCIRDRTRLGVSEEVWDINDGTGRGGA